MHRLVFVTHPEVLIDPDVAIEDWGLSETGRRRAAGFATSDAMRDVCRIWSSTERKARETAQLLASTRGLSVSEHPDLGENDRRATGFLPRPQFEAAADAFFAQPGQSFRGWETAIHAQQRIAGAVRAILARKDAGDVAIVSHGAVGTLLYCHLSGLEIDRRHDQPAQGHFWTAQLPDLRPLHGWQPIH